MLTGYGKPGQVLMAQGTGDIAWVDAPDMLDAKYVDAIEKFMREEDRLWAEKAHQLFKTTP